MFSISIVALNLIFALSFVWLWPEQKPWFAVVGVCLLLTLWFLMKRENTRRTGILNKLESGLLSLKDGDFAVSLADKEHETLVSLFNDVTDKLRVERQSLYQREMLLDKIVNASSVISVLLNHREQVVFTNHAARHFFQKNSILGLSWHDLVLETMPVLAKHNEKTNAIVSLPDQNGVEQSWYLSRHELTLHGARHQLIMLKPITRELHSQELQTWKKVIRVINHELNNSIAPISSMCHSGNILAEKLQHAQLHKVFTTISARINKLSSFIQNYSELARLSEPQKQSVDLLVVVNQIKALYEFELVTELDTLPVDVDVGQFDQVLINLVKNAQQAIQEQGNNAVPMLVIKMDDDSVVIKVWDTGPGMSLESLTKAFLPYYSTKPNGSGIGLSICRDVIEAHQGTIELSNRQPTGLEVKLTLPLTE